MQSACGSKTPVHAALAAEVLAMEAALRTKEAALQARAAAHKAEFAFLLQSNAASQQARDAVVLSTALFPFSSDAAHGAPFVLLSKNPITTGNVTRLLEIDAGRSLVTLELELLLPRVHCGTLGCWCNVSEGAR